MSKYHAPNHAQMITAVKPGDRYYRIRRKRAPFWLQQLAYAVMVLILLIASFAGVFVIAEALSTRIVK